MPVQSKYLLSGKSHPYGIQKLFLFFSLVFDKYMTISGFQVEETIDRETSGNLEQLLLAVGRCFCNVCGIYRGKIKMICT